MKQDKMGKSTLTEQSYWDDVVENTVLPRIYNNREYNVSRFDALFRTYMSRDANTFFEVGCGASGWLPYFKQHYRLSVSGLDYSDIGCKIAERNLEYFGRELNEVIYCKDLMLISEGECGFHDIIFSYGVLEHFEDPLLVLTQLGKLLNSQGQIITVVPNLVGWYGPVLRRLFPKIFEMHKTIDSKMLLDLHDQAGYQKEFCGYFGTFYLEAIPWTSVEGYFFRAKIIRRIFLACIANLARWITAGLRMANITIETERWSPYVVFIGRKINNTV